METIVIILGFAICMAGIVFLLNALVNTSHHYFHLALYLRSNRRSNEKLIKDFLKGCP